MQFHIACKGGSKQKTSPLLIKISAGAFTGFPLVAVCIVCLELCSSRLQLGPWIHQFPDQVQLVQCWRTLLTCWRFACKEEILAKLECLNLCWMGGKVRYWFLCNWTFCASFCSPPSEARPAQSVEREASQGLISKSAFGVRWQLLRKRFTRKLG